jgi:hypothetical protein
MYIWTKRQFVLDMLRLVDGDGARAAVITHTHNQCTWSPSHGQPLTPSGYRDLFETADARVFGEAGLFADVVSGGPLDLGRQDAAATLEADPALTIVASTDPAVFRPHPLTAPPMTARGEFRINPLYAAESDGDPIRWRLRFPSADYEDEYQACRQYLPDEVTISRAALQALASGRVPRELADLARRHVIVDLPRKYY